MQDGLPSWYDNWLQAPYQQTQEKIEFECENCQKEYDEPVDQCLVCEQGEVKEKPKYSGWL